MNLEEKKKNTNRKKKDVSFGLSLSDSQEKSPLISFSPNAKNPALAMKAWSQSCLHARHLDLPGPP